MKKKINLFNESFDPKNFPYIAKNDNGKWLFHKKKPVWIYVEERNRKFIHYSYWMSEGAYNRETAYVLEDDILPEKSLCVWSASNQCYELLEK